MNSGEAGSVDLWLTLKICECGSSRATMARTARAAGAGAEAEAVRKLPALLRGDREHFGGAEEDWCFAGDSSRVIYLD